MSKATTLQTKAKRVLIIEDEGEMCLVLNILLDSKGLELDHVKTLLAAGEYLQKNKPDVVILDNKLPDGYGVDFISYIKKHFPETRIIMISGFDSSVSDVALENGADIFLAKPFTRDQIYRAIEELTSRETVAEV